MEHNEISATVNVKMDLKERRSEFHQFRSWTRCTVRIEAIKCFPCYVKVSFVGGVQRHPISPTSPATSQVVNINLPGLSVDLATSRTMSHTYGLFWKNNRNRCCIYLAFDSAQLCGSHLQWMQTAIRTLELYRREILETRRASRVGILNGGRFDETDRGLSIDSMQTMSGFNETENIRDLKDILGPLPDLPDSNVNWSRRISGASGIYEEILDCSGERGTPPTGRGTTRRASRASVASGIYEVMRPPMESIHESNLISPPPLPPRTRSNTNQSSEFTRSYTNPESETFKKRSYNLFDFLRHKRSGSCNGNPETDGADPQMNTPPTSADSGISMASTCMKPRTKLFDNINAANKRSSFSSPDLTKIDQFASSSSEDGDPDDDELLTQHVDELNVTADHFQRSNSNIFLNSSSPNSSPEPMQMGTSESSGPSITASQRTSASSLPSTSSAGTPPPMYQTSPPPSPVNISQNILPSYNISCNMSMVNLVGSDVGDVSVLKSSEMEQVGVELVDCTSGYCAMAPIFKRRESPSSPHANIAKPQPMSPYSAAELKRSITCRQGEDDRLARAIDNLLLNDVDVVDSPSYRIVPEVRRELKKERAPPIETSAEQTSSNDCIDQAIYSNIDLLLPIDPTNEPSIPNLTVQTTPAPPPKRHKTKSLLLCNTSPSSATSSCDEKYPSYYPNPNLKKPTTPRRRSISPAPKPTPVRSHHHQTPRTENLYISTPHSKATRKSPPNKVLHKSRAAVDLRHITATRGDLNHVPDSIVTDVPSATIDVENTPATEPVTPNRLYAKYASLSRLSPNRYTASGGGGGAATALRASHTDSAVLQRATSVEKEPSATRDGDGSKQSTANLGSSIKRFASLPRFRKIDFSPLKIRINNVLQRTNSENF